MAGERPPPLFWPRFLAGVVRPELSNGNPKRKRGFPQGVGLADASGYDSHSLTLRVMAAPAVHRSSPEPGIIRVERAAKSQPPARCRASARSKARRGRDCGGRRSQALAIARQHNRQIVDIDFTVALEVAGRPGHSGLAVMRQHNRQVVHVYLAVEFGVAGQGNANRRVLLGLDPLIVTSPPLDVTPL